VTGIGPEEVRYGLGSVMAPVRMGRRDRYFAISGLLQRAGHMGCLLVCTKPWAAVTPQLGTVPWRAVSRANLPRQDPSCPGRVIVSHALCLRIVRQAGQGQHGSGMIVVIAC